MASESTPQPERPSRPSGSSRVTRILVAITVLGVLYVVAAAPIYELGVQAAAGLVDPSTYIQAVMGT